MTTIPLLPVLSRTSPTFKADLDAAFLTGFNSAINGFNTVAGEVEAAINGFNTVAGEVDADVLTVQSNRLFTQSAAAAVAAANPATNAAAAQAAAAAAAVSAGLAQATNPDSPIRLNPRAITANFTVGSAYNATSTGPITISLGVTVTVQDNATWAIH